MANQSKSYLLFFYLKGQKVLEKLENQSKKSSITISCKQSGKVLEPKYKNPIY